MIFTENMQGGQIPFQFASGYNSPSTKGFLNSGGRSILNINIGLGSPNTNNLDASVLLLDGIHNVTSATGTTIRGIYYNPTITSLTGVVAHRAIETTSGDVVFNGGNLGVGEASPTARLQVKGSGSTSATTSLLVQNSSAQTKFFVDDSSVGASIGIGNLINGYSSLYWPANSVGFGLISGGGIGITIGNSNQTSLVISSNQNPVNITSAAVVINSTNQGFLPPRMTNAQRGLITSPAIGLLVYCTDTVEGIYVYKSTGWTFVA
jgi:hypothetical protein